MSVPRKVHGLGLRCWSTSLIDAVAIQAMSVGSLPSPSARGTRLNSSDTDTEAADSTASRAKWPLWFVVVVVVAFSVGTVANVVVESSFAPEQRALLVRDGGALNKVVRTEGETVRNRYWIASVVHDIARGGTFVVPAEGLASEARFELLADVDIEVEAYDPELTQEMVDSFDGHASVTGYGNTIGSTEYFSFVVVWDEASSPVAVLRMWFFKDTMYLVDGRIMGPGEN